jgi:hypothetical protein
MKAGSLIVAAVLAAAYTGAAQNTTADVQLRHDAASKQVAVTIGGKPFTTFRYGDEFPDKPVFYPVVSPNGARVNREFPIVANVPGESTDHPHHPSQWFTYDEVNGTNFWNTDKSGRRIATRQVTTGGQAIVATLEWRDKETRVVLEETKRVVFGGGPDAFWMDHDITLTAPNVAVSMGDTKEGAFGIRLNDTLKENGGSGRYINAEGLETAANVWGKTSPWAAIRGIVSDAAGKHDVTVAIFAHPSSINSPPYWHARDYGLFAVNPFGRRAFDPKQETRITTIGVGQRVQLRFRLAVYAGQVSKARLDQDFAGFQK